MKENKKPEKVAEKVLGEIGVKKGQKVLDFGSGSGNYTIPAAKIVGKEGIVYALDKDKNVLDELMQKAQSLGLENIKRIDTETKMGLDDESVDVIMVYDVLHSYYFPEVSDRKEVLDEVYRISKPDALLSVYPTHMEIEKLKEEIENAFFYLKSEYSGMLVLHGGLEKGQLLNFRKKKRS